MIDGTIQTMKRMKATSEKSGLELMEVWKYSEM